MKDEELVSIKKKLSVEIESLTVRLHEAESRLKNEVENITFFIFYEKFP